jgi:hypothetical protein
MEQKKHKTTPHAGEQKSPFSDLLGLVRGRPEGSMSCGTLQQEDLSKGVMDHTPLRALGLVDSGLGAHVRWQGKMTSTDRQACELV